jgi:hypothetical protein
MWTLDVAGRVEVATWANRWSLKSGATGSFGRTFLFPFLLGLRSRCSFLLVPNLHKGRLEIIR